MIGSSVRPAPRWPVTASVFFALVCLAGDMFPRPGQPGFRYTASDPKREVLNLGWPLALFIYDPLHGIQTGPGTFLVIPAQIFILTTGWIGVALVRWLKKPPPHRINATCGVVSERG